MAALILVAWLAAASVVKFNSDREYGRQNLLAPFWKGLFINLMVIIPGTEVLILLGMPLGSLINIFAGIAYLVLLNVVARSFGIRDRGKNPPPDSQDPPS